MKKIHVISFQMPYPANYGGVIDVYYKLKALKEDGYQTILHTYIYGRDRATEHLQQVADEIHYYERMTGPASQLSLRPYIVESRADERLMANLLKDQSPILFEGLHTCRFIDRSELSGRIRIVRAHNVEHEYYRYLAGSTSSSWKRLYYFLESVRLKWYERKLRHASSIMAISEVEADYFRAAFGSEKVVMLPCFFEQSHSAGLPGCGKYILYHGNLEVEENEKAALHIIREIAPELPGYEFVIAGANPATAITTAASEYGNVRLIPNPSKEEMDSLISGAGANLLITFQNTGVKLKLLNALCRGGHCIVNNDMIAGTGLERACHSADTVDGIIELIKKISATPFTEEDRCKRSRTLNELYSPAKGVDMITRICGGSES